jgi:hypothetical protein
MKTVLSGLIVALVLIAVFSLASARINWAQPVQGRDEVRIELTSNGFNPSEVQHAAGTFAIAVENNTLQGDYTLRLRAEDGTLLNELQVQKGSSAWTVSLQAGRYTLTEAAHEQWLCRIVIQ